MGKVLYNAAVCIVIIIEVVVNIIIREILQLPKELVLVSSLDG